MEKLPLDIQRKTQIHDTLVKLAVPVHWLDNPFQYPGPGSYWDFEQYRDDPLVRKMDIFNRAVNQLPKAPWAKPLKVDLPMLRSDFEYAIILHEFGHLLGGNGGWNGLATSSEFEAWEWAMTNCIGPWSKEMTSAVGEGLISYAADVKKTKVTREMVLNFMQKLGPVGELV